MNGSESIQRVALMFVPFLIAVVGHEFGHGWMAKRWGDRTAEDQGRLTFNPLPHLDLLGTLIFPLISMYSGTSLLFGWAKPVPINPTRFRKYRPGLFWVSLAGPGMNVLIAIVSATLCCVIQRWVPKELYFQEPLMLMTYLSVSLNYSLAIFNLVPLPPLDGSKIIEVFLSYPAQQKYEAVSQYSSWILIGLMISGALSVLAYPIQFLSNLTLNLMGLLFQV